jgi:hypothetical protein
VELEVDAIEPVTELAGALDMDDETDGVAGVELQADRNTRIHIVNTEDHLPDITVSPLLKLWGVRCTN